MSGTLVKNFSCVDFNAEKFVKDLSTECVGAEELRHQRANIQELSENTSAMLKRNVYQNYIQFIETAKEISHLESEMYQLSQLLCEQRSLLSALGTNQMVGIEFEHTTAVGFENDFDYILKEEEPKQKLIKLLENVDGAMNLIDTSGRVCLHEGSLLELDPIEGTPLKKIHAYLFNDILMIASWLSQSNKISLSKCKMQAVYDLKSLAVINIRDLGNVKLAFKLLAFPDTRVFQCASAITKKEWLEKCDQAKKLKVSQATLPNIDIEKKSVGVQQFFPTSRSVPLDFNTIENRIEAEHCHFLPEWILEVTEDLDSCIAQRHFDDAFNLLDRTKTYIQNMQTTQNFCNLKAKIHGRSNSLINVLRKELEMSAEAKSLQGGGLRSARRAVKLLIRLNHSAQACQLYLRLCSAVLKARLRRVKREGSILPYIKQMSAIVFSNISEMSQKFLKIFFPHTTCTSAFIVWCSHELRLFTSHVIKQMFIPQVPLTTLAECIMILRDHCEQKKLIRDNIRYIHDVIMTRTLELYKSVTGQDFKKLIALQEQLYSNLTSSNNPKPAPRTSIPKYSTTEYI
ncbi:exocyst complex component 8 isoform X2 [Phymastichus coffea]|uniref:exocyst complex component 8 isoform X2 n=1 Tax=Phymastichus coffea TaxID=108790 RepID=UPI00273C1F9C|nr:exocyst complex component 8 isoform X2 [Phymastichus coffea]